MFYSFDKNLELFKTEDTLYTSDFFFGVKQGSYPTTPEFMFAVQGTSEEDAIRNAAIKLKRLFIDTKVSVQGLYITEKEMTELINKIANTVPEIFV